MAEDLTGAGKIAEAVERSTREIRELVQSFLGPLAAEAGQYLADKIRIYRYNAAIRALQLAHQRITASGIDPQPIDLKRLIPMIEGASLEEGDDLVARWAGLIASAATGTDTLPAYADILRHLSPEEARMLEFLFDNAANVSGLAEQYEGVDKAELESESGLSREQFLIRIQNLHRLELVVQITIGGLEPVRGFHGWSHSGHVGLTALGEAFVKACRGPERLVVKTT